MSRTGRKKGSRKDSPPQSQGGRGGGPGSSGGAWRGNNPSIMPTSSPRTPSPTIAPPTPNSANGGPKQPGYPNTFAGQSDAAKASVSAPPAVTTPPSADLLGSAIVVTTDTGIRYEGILSPNEHSHPGINLRDAKDIVNPGSALIPTYFIPLLQVANWKKPDPPPAPSTNGTKVLDTFRTDGDISSTSGKPRERELQAWKPDSGATYADTNGIGRDTLTFGSAQPIGQWDQFAVNEQLFGITTDCNEDIYTTKLNRNTSDYKEKERKAQQLADEIQGITASNPHLREERNQGDAAGNEEDKYGAVVRGPNAYVPPGARRSGNGGAVTKSPPPTAATPPIPKVSINPPEGTTERPAERPNGTSQSTPNGKSEQTTTTPPNGANGNKPKDFGVIASFRNFVSSEKERMDQKKQALVKHEKDKRLSELIGFSKSFKSKQTIPDDLVPILAKYQDKQKAIVEKAAKDAEDRKARSIGVAIPPLAGVLPIPNVPPPLPASASSKVANRASIASPIPPFKGGPAKTVVPADAQKRAPIQMTIQEIPPFDPKNLEPNPAAGSGSGASPVSAGQQDPCFKCRQPGHRAREYPNESVNPGSGSPYKPLHVNLENDEREQQSSGPTLERSVSFISSSTTPLAPIADVDAMVTWISPMPAKVNGHFCDVFEGTHLTAGKVALKRPRISVGCNEDIIRRFQREAETWARLRHPHILEYLGTFQRDGHHYFVSPFMKNGTLVEYIALHLSVNRVKLLRETADAITYLHKQDIVHGDIKASNILISNNGQVLLCDFGLTRTTDFRTSTAMRGVGTLRWQSPELLDGGPKSFKSDVYAFGMTIVEVLSGEVPFPDLQTDVAVLRAVCIEGRRPLKDPAESPAGLSYENVWSVAEVCWATSSDERISMSEALHLIQEDPALTAI